MEDLAKRGPGRPKQDPLKKGSPSWKPASLNKFSNLDPDYRYRMIRKDEENLAKKSQEGWEIVSGIHSSQTEHLSPGRIGDHQPLTSVTEGRDWILGRMPEETAKARDAYWSSENDRRTAGLTSHIKKDLAKEGAAMHGEITISSRKGTATI